MFLQRTGFSKQVLFKTINVISACKENPETFPHLLFHCPLTVAFWNDFQEWWLRNIQIELNLTPAKVLYGVIDNSKFCTLFNFALLVAKFYIYRCSLDDEPLFFHVFETELREKARIEYDIAKDKGYLKHFKIKWEPLIRDKFIEEWAFERPLESLSTTLLL